jgi:dTDP-4-dehydrorhamnose reductase
VGAALARCLAARHRVIVLPRQEFDLADAAGMKRVLAELECDVLLNPAGLTGVEDCLDHPDRAWRVNAEAPGELAAWALRHGVRLIHFSTDYVFGGREPGLRHEHDPVEPLSDYGRSKAAGEQAVLALPTTCVLRVSWVFGPEKPSYVDRVRSQALAGEPLAAVADKFSLPTFTRDLAEWTHELVIADATGIFHACNSGEPVSWHGLAEETVRLLHQAGELDAVPPVASQRLEETSSFRAVRPRHTAMATTRLTELLGRPPRPWQEALADHLARR